MGSRIILPFVMPLLDNDGNPITGATIQFYQAGTSTPKAVFADADLTVSLGSVLTTDAAGRLESSGGDPVLGVFASFADVYDMAVTSGDWSPTFENVIVTGGPGNDQPQADNILRLEPRTDFPAAWPNGQVLADGDTVRRSDIMGGSAYVYSGGQWYANGPQYTRELTEFVPESVQANVFFGGADASPYIQAAVDTMGPGGRLLLPGRRGALAIMDMESQITIPHTGFVVQGTTGATVLRQKYTGGTSIVLGTTAGAQAQDITLNGILFTRLAGDHAILDVKQVRTLTLEAIRGSGIWRFIDWGATGLTSAYQINLIGLDIAMALAGHDDFIRCLNTIGGLHIENTFCEADHTTSQKAFCNLATQSTDVPRFDGLGLRGGNLKGWWRGINADERRIVNVEAFGARCDEVGDAFLYVGVSDAPFNLGRVGCESVNFAGVVQGSGALANTGSIVKVRQNGAGADVSGIKLSGCQANQPKKSVIDIETHVSNGARVSQVQIDNFSVLDGEWDAPNTYSVILFKNRVDGVMVQGVDVATLQTDKPKYLVDLDLNASTPANSAFVGAVRGDATTGILNDPLSRNADTVLPIGSAANADTGTSGATVPLCNGANTWGATQAFTSTTRFGSITRETYGGTMADDTAISLTLAAGRVGRVEVVMGGAKYGLAMLETIAPSSLVDITSSSQVDYTTGGLTGTTGTDGHTTISVDGAVLYVENRRGGAQSTLVIVEYVT